MSAYVCNQVEFVRLSAMEFRAERGPFVGYIIRQRLDSRGRAPLGKPKFTWVVLRDGVEVGHGQRWSLPDAADDVAFLLNRGERQRHMIRAVAA